MNTCPTSEILSAYHDGQLSGDRAATLKTHIADCDICQLELSRLAALSRLIGGVIVPKLSQIARARLHNKAELAMERGLVRFGWGLSGIAASVLLVGSALLMHMGNEKQATEAAPPWVGVAVNSEADSVVRNASTPAAAVYLADASVGTSNPD